MQSPNIKKTPHEDSPLTVDKGTNKILSSSHPPMMDFEANEEPLATDALVLGQADEKGDEANELCSKNEDVESGYGDEDVEEDEDSDVVDGEKHDNDSGSVDLSGNTLVGSEVSDISEDPRPKSTEPPDIENLNKQLKDVYQSQLGEPSSSSSQEDQNLAEYTRLVDLIDARKHSFRDTRPTDVILNARNRQNYIPPIVYTTRGIDISGYSQRGLFTYAHSLSDVSHGKKWRNVMRVTRPNELQNDEYCDTFGNTGSENSRRELVKDWEDEMNRKTNRRALKAMRAAKRSQNNPSRSTVDSSTQTYVTNAQVAISSHSHHQSTKRSLGDDETRHISDMLIDFSVAPSQNMQIAPPQDQASARESEVRWMPKLSDSASGTRDPLSFGKSGKGWPKNRLAVELFERVIRGVSRADALNLRLVNKEFERNVSSFVFRTVVVPFRPQIYRNLATDCYPKDFPTSTAIDSGKLKGKGKARETQDKQGTYGVSYNVKDVVYDGMEVFKAWGSHIRKFAMTFDVDQELFQKPPTKGIYEDVQAFWGSYLWPHRHYTRYQSCEDQEKRADETRLMTVALSNLTQVNELGLSVDNGLGWIDGPDVSDRSRIFEDKAPIFGSRYPPSKNEALQRIQIWEALTAHIGFDTIQNYHSIQDVATASGQDTHPLYEFLRKFYPDKNVPNLPTYSRNFPPLIFDGIDLDRKVTPGLQTPDASFLYNVQPFRYKNALLVPNFLKPAQKEWLLENYWAQMAFLTSWSLAVVDNASTFRNVRTLTIAHLSSKYLHTLQRQDIWTTLENLDCLVLMVSPDWRDIFKDDQELIQAPNIRPSDASFKFHEFLTNCIVGAASISKLTIGYVGGGERARGMYARNKHVLPTPVLDFGHEVGAPVSVLMLPHVQHLTLSNCWIAPDAFKTFALGMSAHKLETLTLDSVSLTVPFQTTPPFIFEEANQMIPGPIAWNPHPHQTPHHFFPVQVPESKEAWRDYLFQRGIDTTIIEGPSAPDRKPADWFMNGPVSGSWPDVINAITPGETLDHKRHLYAYLREKPEPRSRLALRQIKFVSCGYVRLLSAHLDQTSIGGVLECAVPALRRRLMELSQTMMSVPDDQLLGTISTTIKFEEVRCLVSGFGLHLGWPDDDDAKYEFREDGQPKGGSGRFSGLVERKPDKACKKSL